MIPSDAGGPGWFDWSADIVLPALGFVAAVAVPLIVLYWQRHVDDKRLQDERARAEQLRAKDAAERVQTARKVAIRSVVAEVAPFIGMDLLRRDLDLHPYLVDLRIAAMALVDEYPVEHAINDLVGAHQNLGSATARAIDEDAPIWKRGSISLSQRLIKIEPMHRWAAEYTHDLRAILGGDVTEEQMAVRTKVIAGTIASLYERNEWGDPPNPNIR